MPFSLVYFVLLIQFPTTRWSTPSPSGGGEYFALFRAISLTEYFPHKSLTAFQKRLGVYGCCLSSAGDTHRLTGLNRGGSTVCRADFWNVGIFFVSASQILSGGFTISHFFSLSTLELTRRRLPTSIVLNHLDEFLLSGKPLAVIAFPL